MKKYGFSILACLMLFPLSLISNNTKISPIQNNSKQMVLVVASHQDSSEAFLSTYERNDSKSEWHKVKNEFNVIVAKRGLAWGNGLHTISNEEVSKHEGDFKSPEGVFELSKVFGFLDVEDAKNIKMPYVHISKMLECIDDESSKYYNNLIERDLVDSVDWNSSEEMIKYKTWYDFGVVINHNTNPIIKGSGSCIFLHYWEDENDSTIGCTAMEPEKMRDIIYWLDSISNPVLVQLSRVHYEKYKSIWNLPEIIK